MRFLLILCICFSVSSFSQSRLKKAKENILKEQSNSFTHSDSSDRAKNRKNSFETYLFAELVFKPLVWAGKSLVIGDKEVRVFNPIPYEKNSSGEYLKLGDKEDYRINLLQVTTYYSNGKYRINGLHVDLEYRFSDLIGITARHSHFYENHFGKTENLDLSGLTFNYYRIREKFITAWWSLGVSHATNNVNSVGFRYGLGAQVFVKKPISILLAWQQDFIDSGTINECKINVVYHLKKLNIFTGYNHYNLATVKTPSIVIGLRYKLR